MSIDDRGSPRDPMDWTRDIPAPLMGQPTTSTYTGKAHMALGSITPDAAQGLVAQAQIEHLARFLQEEFPKAPGRQSSESAVDCAVRLLRAYKEFTVGTIAVAARIWDDNGLPS